MNDTTITTSITINPVPVSPSLLQISLLFRDLSIVSNFYLWGFLVTFIFGFIGNVASLLTFFRPTLRKMSTGCLFIILAISDITCLIIFIFDFVEFGLKIPLYNLSSYDELCRFRWFVMYVSQLCSAWLLVFISFDRWIRTRFPFKSKSLCTRKHVLIFVGVLLIIDIGLHSHMLTPSFGGSILGVATVACGPNFNNVFYKTFFQNQWSFIQLFISSLIPAILMMIFVVDIFIVVRKRKRTVFASTNQTQQHDINGQHRDYAQKQMFLLMLSTIVVFLFTTLPLAVAHAMGQFQPSTYEAWKMMYSVFAGTTWLQSLSYAVNFYIHCLTSKLFRTEFKQQLNFIFRKIQIHFISETHSKRNARIQHT